MEQKCGGGEYTEPGFPAGTQLYLGAGRVYFWVIFGPCPNQ